MQPRTIWLALVLLMLALAPATSADDARFVVVVNPKNPITNVDRDLLRNMFLKKRVVWGNGETIRPIDLSTKFTAREQFVRRVLKKTPAQLKSYWTQQIFSGKGVPPPEAASPTDVVRYVLAHPGAIGYVPVDSDVQGAKVIEVK
jgi:ABC-type phosphate transport system substrate-binding protein